MRPILLACSILCAPQMSEAAELLITYHAIPEGATLIENGSKVWGQTPMTLKYEVPRRWKGCLTLPPMKVQWMSGAEASVGEERLYGMKDVLDATLKGIEMQGAVVGTPLQACAEHGRRQQFTFQRPTGLDGLDVDIQYAGQLQQLAVLQQQLAVQRSAAQQQYLFQQQMALQQSFAAQQAAWEQIRAITQQRWRTTVSCASRVIGAFVYTNCY